MTRHGETLTNRAGVFCGHSETELTDTGRQQAYALAQRLRDEPLAAIYTSGMGRAIETGRIVAGAREVPFFVLEGLREINYGDWELQKERSIARRYPEQYRLMRAENPAWQPPGGETTGMVRRRTVAALRHIANRHRHQSVLLVSHGTAVQCMLSGILGMAPTHTFRIEASNCGLSVVSEAAGHLVVLSLNETAFLPARRGASLEPPNRSGEQP